MRSIITLLALLLLLTGCFTLNEPSSLPASQTIVWHSEGSFLKGEEYSTIVRKYHIGKEWNPDKDEYPPMSPACAKEISMNIVGSFSGKEDHWILLSIRLVPLFYKKNAWVYEAVWENDNPSANDFHREERLHVVVPFTGKVILPKRKAINAKVFEEEF